MTTDSKKLVKYLSLVLLAGIAIWQISSGNSSFGSGLLAGVIITGIITEIRQRRVAEMQKKVLTLMMNGPGPWPVWQLMVL